MSSLHDLCLCKLIEKFDQYSPEMLSILPPVQRKELLLHCPVVSICHLEQICAFNGIDSDMKFSRIRLRCMEIIVVVTSMLMKSYYMHRNIKFFSSSHEKYFTFLTAMIFCGDHFSGHYAMFINKYRINGEWEDCFDGSTPPPEECSCPDDIVNHLVVYRKPVIEDVGSKEQLLK